MRHTILVATLSSVAASVLTTVVIGGSLFGAGTASSANAPIELDSAISPGGVEDILQGDVDCGGNVTPVDSLKVLRHDAGLSVLQDEPCPDIGTVIPAGEGVPGPQGPAGPQGEQGPPGISGVEIATAQSDGVNESFRFTSALCDAGKVVLGGGAGLAGDISGIDLHDSLPIDNPVGWFVQARTDDGMPKTNWQVNAYAICATVAE